MADSTPAPALSPPVLAADKLADFSDRLSPMLVKELRQGLRAKTFVSVFLALQAMLALVLLAAAGAASGQNAGQVISGVIFMFFSIAVMVIQPLRGIGALHSEMKGNTMELMVLTRLSAWRIVLGKWVALVSQSALLLAAIAPYLILRYWFGDMNLLGELVLLILIFLGSALATALTVGLSAVSSVIIRGLLPLIGGFWLIVGCIALSFGRGFEELVDICSMQDTDDRWGILIIVLSGIYIGWSILGLGASMIAPAAENHSSPRRLVTITALVIAILIAWVAEIDDEICAVLAFIICVPAIIMALTEHFYLLPPVCRPFVKRGNFGRVAGRFLYPGWPSGVLFTLLTLALGSILLFAGERPRFDGEEVGFISALVGSMVLPALILAFIEKRVRNRFAVYFLILVTMLVFTIVMALVAEAMPRGSRGFLWIFAWIPMVGPMLDEVARSDEDLVALVNILFTSAYTLLLLFFASRRFGSIREVEDSCLEEASPAPAQTDPVVES